MTAASHPSTDPRLERALVLFSGGQDSTTCLAWALDRFAAVETVGFDYHQRHHVELDCRIAVLDRLRREFPGWDARLGADHLVDLGVLGQISETALTRDTAVAFTETGLPNTFVPGRNLVFFAFAAAIGYRRGARHLVGGMCETDYSGYPDCRDDTLKALQASLSLGLDRRVVIHTPLMWRDKGATWALAERLGGKALVVLIRDETHSCYLGDRTHRHDWGYGCGECPACGLRCAGWDAFTARASSTSAPSRSRLRAELSGDAAPIANTPDPPWPGSTRPSSSPSAGGALHGSVDGRVKPGHGKENV